MADSDDTKYYPTQFQIDTDVFGFQISESVKEHNYHKNQVYETKEDIMKKSSLESSKVMKFLSCLGIVWSMNGLKSNCIIAKSGSGNNMIWEKAEYWVFDKQH